MRRTAFAVALLASVVPAAADARPGDLDRSFGRAGVARTEVLESATVLRVEPGGTILAAGGTTSPGVVKLSARGRRDVRFGRRGVAVVRRFGAFRPLALRRDRAAGVSVLATAVGVDTAPAATLRWTARGRGATARMHSPFDGPVLGGAARPGGGGGAIIHSPAALRAATRASPAAR